MAHNIKSGVATGDEVQEIFNYAKKKGFALPAVNVIGSNTINGVLETAVSLNAPVIIQFSNGGAQFNAGKGLSNENQQAAIQGAIAGAKHVHQLAEAYGAASAQPQTLGDFADALHAALARKGPTVIRVVSNIAQ